MGIAGLHLEVKRTSISGSAKTIKLTVIGIVMMLKYFNTLETSFLRASSSLVLAKFGNKTVSNTVPSVPIAVSGN